MAAHQSCRLPALPPELRNIIYAYAAEFCTITRTAKGEENDGLTRVELANGPNTKLLRACKQINYEYKDAWARNLNVHIGSPVELDLRPDRLSLHPSFPLEVLQRRVDSCSFTVNFTALTRTVRSDDLLGWASRPSPALEPTDDRWTPSGATTGNLIRLLSQLATWMPNLGDVDLSLLYMGNVHTFTTFVERHYVQPAAFAAI